MIEYNTRVVGGVSPKKAGQQHLGLPVFGSVHEAREKTGADASVIYVPPGGCAAAIEEAIDAEVCFDICFFLGRFGNELLNIQHCNWVSRKLIFENIKVHMNFLFLFLKRNPMFIGR